LPLLLFAGCAQRGTIATDKPIEGISLAPFRIAAAHSALERPRLPDTLKKKDDDDDKDSGSVAADDRPLCVLYRPSWQSISTEGIDGDFRFEQRDSKLLPDQIKRRNLRLPVVQWNNGDRWYSAEFHGPADFNAMRLRLRDKSQQVVQQNSREWTYPGNIFDHLRSSHGTNADGLSVAEAERLHSSIHNAEVARQRQRNCPGGRCPIR